MLAQGWPWWTYMVPDTDTMHLSELETSRPSPTHPTRPAHLRAPGIKPGSALVPNDSLTTSLLAGWRCYYPLSVGVASRLISPTPSDVGATPGIPSRLDLPERQLLQMPWTHVVSFSRSRGYGTHYLPGFHLASAPSLSIHRLSFYLQYAPR